MGQKEKELKKFQNVSVVNFRTIQKEVNSIIEKANRQLNEDFLKIEAIASSFGVKINGLNEEIQIQKTDKQIAKAIKKAMGRASRRKG